MRRARRTGCPNARGAYLWALSSDRAAEVACGRWDCSWCQWRKRAAAKLVLASGMERAWARGERIRFMTLTDDSKGAMTVADFYEAWNRLRVRLKKAGLLREFAAVLEVQTRGALHLHVLQSGEYIQKNRLKGMAKAAGFGRCTDIREVKRDAVSDAKKSADYVVKQMAGYLSKQNAEALSAKTNKRRRPLRTSRRWGLSMTEALRLLSTQRLEEMDKEPNAGPWALIRVLADGDLLVRLDGEWHRWEGDSKEADRAKPTRDDNGAKPPTGGATEEEQGGEAAEAAGTTPRE